MSRVVIKIKLNEEEREELGRRIRSVTTSKRDSLRAELILFRAEGKSQKGCAWKRTKTHDYIRHRAITLFAALSYLDGKLVSRVEKDHTHGEWLRFLKQINRESPKELDLYLIVDNYSTHKEDKVKQWVEKHPRFHIHFTPTSNSWMNLVERFFAYLTNNAVHDGSFTSVHQLARNIETYLAERNLNPKRYQWKAKGEEVLR